MENAPAPSPPSATSLSDDAEITPEKAELIERNVAAYLAYTIECYDHAKTDGANVLQWLFGVVTGGMAMIGPVAMAGHWWLAVALAFPVLRAALLAARLVPELNSKYTYPPGNYAGSLNTMLDDTVARMRWREATGVDARIRHNNEAVHRVASAVDRARLRFAQLPYWFLAPAVVGASVQFLLL